MHSSRSGDAKRFGSPPKSHDGMSAFVESEHCEGAETADVLSLKTTFATRLTTVGKSKLHCPALLFMIASISGRIS
jgi:hypothetical protein